MVQPKEEVQKENLETIQKSSLDAVKEIEHTTKLERHKDAKKVCGQRLLLDKGHPRGVREPLKGRCFGNKPRKRD